jgi:hypothetical protein
VRSQSSAARRTRRWPPRSALTCALALAGAGFSLISGGDPARGQTLMEQSLPLFRQAGDLLGAALAAASLGHQLAGQGGPPRSRGKSANRSWAIGAIIAGATAVSAIVTTVAAVIFNLH